MNADTGQLELNKDMPWDEVRTRLADPLTDEARFNRQFVIGSLHATIIPEVADYVTSSFPPGRPLLDGVHDLMDRVHH